MPLTLVIRIALRALRRNTLRSVLSMLGISIGVGAFICSVAVGQGASRQIEEQIKNKLRKYMQEHYPDYQILTSTSSLAHRILS